MKKTTIALAYAIGFASGYLAGFLYEVYKFISVAGGR